MTLRTGTEEWHRDLKLIGDRLHSLGLPEREGAPQALPAGLIKQRLPGLTEEELATALQDPDLRSWEPWEEVLPHEYPLTRQELRRVFEFDAFAEAVKFMNFLAPRFRSCQSSPQMGERVGAGRDPPQTWAAGNRLTQVDLDVAKQVEQWHRDFRASSP